MASELNADVRDCVVAGTLFHAPYLGAVEVLKDVLIIVDADGIIRDVVRKDDALYVETRRSALQKGRLREFPEQMRLLPGFVDLHIHAPQYAQIGTALHVPLENWLLNFTFPLEARFCDLAFAEAVYAALIDDLVAGGTTTAVMFATIHVPATCLLADIAITKGLRAFIGKVAMDNPALCPANCCDGSVRDAVEGSRVVGQYIDTHPANRQKLVQPIITPRFVPACTSDTLKELAGLAEAMGYRIQTHCAEDDWENAYVPEHHGMSDAQYLDSVGLLKQHTVLAHGVMLADDDFDLIRTRHAAVAHCPLSNVYFSNAVFPLKRALHKGVRVGLGTDISGGPSVSMFDACRFAVAAARMLDEGVDASVPPHKRSLPGSRIDWREAFHVATAGGAQALGLPVGTFAPGFAFDALLIDLEAEKGSIRVFPHDDEEAKIQKILFGASRANIAEVWVQGASILQAADKRQPRRASDMIFG